MVYGLDYMLPMEINTPTWQRLRFNKEDNQVGLESVADLIEEIQEMSHIQEYALKQRTERRYNTKVWPRTMVKGNLLLTSAVDLEKKGKLHPN